MKTYIVWFVEKKLTLKMVKTKNGGLQLKSKCSICGNKE